MQKPIPISRILGVVVLILLILGVISALSRGRNQGTKPAEQETTANNNQDSLVQNDPASEPSYLFMDPNEWPLTKKMEGYLATLLPQQEIQFSIVTDPTDTNVVYFATTAPSGTDEQTTTLTIYQADSTTYAYERLYKATYAQGEAPGLREGENGAWPVWHVIGMDRGSLVVLVQDADNSPGICAELLIVGVDGEMAKSARLMQLNLSNPNSGLQAYTPSKKTVDAAREKQEQCVENMP